MTLAERLLEIDRLIQPAHLLLNTAAQGRTLNPAVATVESAIRDLTLAREKLNDLAAEPQQN